MEPNLLGMTVVGADVCAFVYHRLMKGEFEPLIGMSL